MLKKIRIGIEILVLVILFIGVICVASAAADSSQDTQSKDVISEFNDSNSQSEPLPDFSPQTFQNLKNDPNVLATKGKIPQYATQAERQNWLDKLDTTYKLIRDDEMSPYTYPKGPVLEYGFNFDGYIEVVFYKGMNVSDSQINEIYNVINKKANEASVQDVPVVFKKSDFFHDDIATGDLGTVNETSNLSVSEEKNVTELNNSRNNSSESTDNIPQRLPLTFGPETLDKLKSSPDFISAYGSIPAFTTSEERKQWLDKLNNVYQGAISEMSKYEYPNGPVTSFGYTIDGVIQVGINRSRTVDKPFMDEIYQIFDSNANRMEIKEIPVVFVHEDNYVPTIKIDPIIKTTNSSVYGEKNSLELNNNSSRNKSSKNNSIPDIGVFGSFICLCSGWRLRKK
jgi:hypothetical protein